MDVGKMELSITSSKESNSLSLPSSQYKQQARLPQWCINDPKFDLPISFGHRFYCQTSNTVFELGDQIGSGAAAVVHKCRRVLPPVLSTDTPQLDMLEEFAVKVMNLRGLRLRPDFDREKEKLRREVTILSSLHHPCIVNLIRVVETPEHLFLIMELVEGGELFYKIVEHGSLTEDQTRYVVLQILHAVDYMHGKGVIHRDLKPENILLSEEVASGFFRIKVADFGLAKLVINGYSAAKTFVGTPQYWAPEVIHCQTEPNTPYGPEVDLWSLGCVIYVMLGGAYPFDSRLGPVDVLIKNAQYHFRYTRFQRVSKMAKDLIRGLLTVDPLKRFTLHDVFNHPWIQTYHIPENVPLLPSLDPIPSNKELPIAFDEGNPFLASRESDTNKGDTRYANTNDKIAILPQRLINLPTSRFGYRNQGSDHPPPDMSQQIQQLNIQMPEEFGKRHPYLRQGLFNFDQTTTNTLDHTLEQKQEHNPEQQQQQQNITRSNTKAIVPITQRPPALPWMAQMTSNTNIITPRNQQHSPPHPTVPSASRIQANSTSIKMATGNYNSSSTDYMDENITQHKQNLNDDNHDKNTGYYPTYHPLLSELPKSSQCGHNSVQETTKLSNYNTETAIGAVGIRHQQQYGGTLGKCQRDEFVKQAEVIFNFDELLCLQISIMKKFHWAYIALRHSPQAAQQISECILEARTVQLESTAIVAQFQATCSSVLGLLPDLSLAVSERKIELAICLFEDIRTWVAGIRHQVEAHQEHVGSFIRRVNELVEAVRAAKSAADKTIMTTVARLSAETCLYAGALQPPNPPPSLPRNISVSSDIHHPIDSEFQGDVDGSDVANFTQARIESVQSDADFSTETTPVPPHTPLTSLPRLSRSLSSPKHDTISDSAKSMNQHLQYNGTNPSIYPHNDYEVSFYDTLPPATALNNEKEEQTIKEEELQPSSTLPLQEPHPRLSKRAPTVESVKRSSEASCCVSKKQQHQRHDQSAKYYEFDGLEQWYDEIKESVFQQLQGLTNDTMVKIDNTSCGNLSPFSKHDGFKTDNDVDVRHFQIEQPPKQSILPNTYFLNTATQYMKKDRTSEEAVSNVAHELLDLLFMSPQSWIECHRRFALQKRLENGSVKMNNTASPIYVSSQRQHQNQKEQPPVSSLTTARDEASIEEPLSDPELIHGFEEEKNHDNNHLKEYGQEFCRQAFRTSELLVRAMDELRRIDQILCKSTSFWLNVTTVIERLCQMKIHAERLLQYTATSAVFAERFFERLGDYHKFWSALWHQAHNYAQQSNAKLAAIDEFAVALATTADRVDTANALHFGNRTALLRLQAKGTRDTFNNPFLKR